MFRKRKSFGLALGSGGAKGMLHIGVLRALERESYIPDMIGGSSIGALLGAMYVSGMSPNEIQIKKWLLLK